MNTKSILKLAKQLFKYGIVGVINTLITWVTMRILIDILHQNYSISNFVGYLLGFINSFVMNKLWTFKSKGNTKKETVIFVLVFAATYLIQYGFVQFMINSAGLAEKISTLIGMVVYTFIGFFANKFITFRTKQSNPS